MSTSSKLYPLNQNPYQNVGQAVGFSNNRRYYDAGQVTAEEFNATIGSSASATTTVELDPLQDVREVVRAIEEARPLPTSQGLDALIRRAAALHGTPEDIESWARKLANETSKLND